MGCATVPHDSRRRTGHGERRSGVRQVVGPDVRPRSARSDRVHGAVGVMPSPLWLMLFFATALVLVFMLFFADSGNAPVVQGLMIGSGRVRDRRHADGAVDPGQPVPLRHRRSATSRHGTHAGDPPPGARSRRGRRAAALRHSRESAQIAGRRVGVCEPTSHDAMPEHRLDASVEVERLDAAEGRTCPPSNDARSSPRYVGR